jgi:hypothetical protein
MYKLPDTIYTTVDGQPWRYNPSVAGPTLAREIPLTCGHPFQGADVVWFGRPVDEQAAAETQVLCGGCVEQVGP